MLRFQRRRFLPAALAMALLIAPCSIPHVAAAAPSRPAAASTPVGTLLIGTYLVQKEALTPAVLTAAKGTMSSSNQGMYYRSEFANGAWMNISNANDSQSLFKDSKGAVTFDAIDRMKVEFWVYVQDGKTQIVTFLTPSELNAALTDAKEQLEAKKQAAQSASPDQLSQMAIDLVVLQAQVDFLTAMQNGEPSKAVEALEKQADPAASVPDDVAKAQASQRQQLQKDLDQARSDLAAAQSAGDAAKIATLQAKVQDLTEQLRKLDQQATQQSVEDAKSKVTALLGELQQAVAASQSQAAIQLLPQLVQASDLLMDLRQGLLQQQLVTTSDANLQAQFRQQTSDANQATLQDLNRTLRKAHEQAKLTGQIELANRLLQLVTENNAKREKLRQTDRQQRIADLQAKLAVLRPQATQNPSEELLLTLVTTEAQLTAEQQSLPDKAAIAKEEVEFLQGLLDTFRAEGNAAGVADVNLMLAEAKQRGVHEQKAQLFVQKYAVESELALLAKPSAALAKLHTDTIVQIEALEKSRYADADLKELKRLSDLLDKQLGDQPHQILPVENLISSAIDFTLAAPLVRINGTTMVPIRTLLEGFGARVDWGESDQSVRVEYRGRTVVCQIGSNRYMVNGTVKTIEGKPLLAIDRTYVPLRLIVEAFGFDVAWDELTQTIDIKALPQEVL